MEGGAIAYYALTSVNGVNRSRVLSSPVIDCVARPEVRSGCLPE
jgi:hypothetical protein